ncbi:hypothetical protein BDQ12DRAFT_687738 [Crucibulum laeve]|uniref:Ricin B lectin domain-containing protein n=1 Tax=Crucibulum laeve TaxID=68775 RepID=A0A5C3LRT8_9AGAR|nr:hypothetical protein BDQ12DRAFT_687738 [Crucibulum laeve]
MSRPIEQGSYRIKSFTEDGYYLGIGDSSRVVALKSGDAPVWNIKAAADTFIIWINGKRITSDNGQLRTGSSDGTTWSIQHPEGYDPKVFTIENRRTGTGWILGMSDSNTEVTDRVLIIGPSFPPYYPPNELWVFERA